MKNSETIHDLAIDMLSRLCSEGKEVLQGVRILSTLTNDDSVPDIEHMAAMQALSIIQQINNQEATQATPEILSWVTAQKPSQEEQDLLEMALTSLEIFELFDTKKSSKQ